MPVIGREPLSSRAVVRMEDHDKAYWEWKRRGYRGRTLVHFDGHLDFNWIEKRRPHELLAARGSRALDALVGGSPNWVVEDHLREDRIHIGNFIAPAVAQGIVSRFYWVVPDPFMATPKAREALERELTQVLRNGPGRVPALRWTGRRLDTRLGDCPLTVCRLRDVPPLDDTLLLDIDVDYFVTWRADSPPPYYDARPVAPWTPMPAVLRLLRQKAFRSDCVTICDSVNEGYTPMRFKFLGDQLVTFMRRPNARLEKAPPASAAGLYPRFERALGQGDLADASRFWRRIVRQDPSYRTLYATPALRDERNPSRRREALAGYEQWCALEPRWHVAHFGRGRALWALGRVEEAESAFRQAMALTPSPTFAAYWLGLCLEKRGDGRGAARVWRKAQRWFPEHPSIPEALCRVDEALAKKRVMSTRAPRWTRHPHVRERRRQTETTLYHPGNADVLRLNSVASYVWTHLRRKPTADELVRECQKRFAAEAAVISRDVRSLLERLRRLNYVQEVAHAPR